MQVGTRPLVAARGLDVAAQMSQPGSNSLPSGFWPHVGACGSGAQASHHGNVGTVRPDLGVLLCVLTNKAGEAGVRFLLVDAP
jgi:hypothetical protein